MDRANKGRYVLGIECGGSNYHASLSARERDRLPAVTSAGLLGAAYSDGKDRPLRDNGCPSGLSEGL